MNPSDKQQINEEYWADRDASRHPMRKATNPQSLAEWSAMLAKKVFRDAEEAGIPDSDVEKMKARMREWHQACVAYQRDRAEVMRDCKDPYQLIEILATMMANQDSERERIFGE